MFWPFSRDKFVIVLFCFSVSMESCMYFLDTVVVLTVLSDLYQDIYCVHVLLSPWFLDVMSICIPVVVSICITVVLSICFTDLLYLCVLSSCLHVMLYLIFLILFLLSCFHIFLICSSCLPVLMPSCLLVFMSSCPSVFFSLRWSLFHWTKFLKNKKELKILDNC